MGSEYRQESDGMHEAQKTKIRSRSSVRADSNEDAVKPFEYIAIHAISCADAGRTKMDCQTTLSRMPANDLASMVSRDTPLPPYRLDSIGYLLPSHRLAILVFHIVFVSNVAKNASHLLSRPRAKLDSPSSCHPRLAHQIPDQHWPKFPLTSGRCPKNHDNRLNQKKRSRKMLIDLRNDAASRTKLVMTGNNAPKHWVRFATEKSH